MHYAPRALCISLSPHSLSSLQRACNSNLCLTRWQLFFFFLQLKFAQLDLEMCLFPQLWHPSKSGLCLSFPWIETLLSFFLFKLSCYSFLRIKSFSSFITSTWTHNGAHFPLARNQAVPILTLNIALFIVCDLWSGPGAPGCLRWLTFLEPLRNKIFLEDCLQEQTVKYFFMYFIYS